MQINLQTKLIKKIFIGVCVLALCIAVMMFVLRFRNKEFSDTKEYTTENSKYLVMCNKNSIEHGKDVLEKDSADSSKMNNFDAENSINEKSIDLSTNVSNVKASGSQLVCLQNNNIIVYDHDALKNMEISLEDYVVGCVCAEMPASFDLQALMAQAVAARSFTVRKMLYDDSSTHKNAVVCTDYRHCQSYISKSDYLSLSTTAEQQYEKIRQAVYGTRGVIAMYDGEPIMAVYHASSGHATKSCKDVWGGDIPYLVSVSAPEQKGVCAKEYEFSYEQISNKLSAQAGKAVQCSSSAQMSVKTTDNSQSVSVSGVSFEPEQIKKALGLRSEYFDVALNNDGVTFTTYGYGHLVGMSQYGADALAKQGKSYIDILKYYYKGIELGYLN